MAAIKPIDQSATKWQQRAAVAGPAYTSGVQNPKTSWATAAGNAESNYGAGVTAAVSAKRYSSGVRKAGDTKWQTAAVAKGSTRYPEGVSMAVGTWTSAFQPYQSAISSVMLPARGPTGSPNNLQRVSAIANALHNLKLKGSTA
jgi:hypothetical protein